MAKRSILDLFKNELERELEADASQPSIAVGVGIKPEISSPVSEVKKPAQQVQAPAVTQATQPAAPVAEAPVAQAQFIPQASATPQESTPQASVAPQEPITAIPSASTPVVSQEPAPVASQKSTSAIPQASAPAPNPPAADPEPIPVNPKPAPVPQESTSAPTPASEVKTYLGADWDVGIKSRFLIADLGEEDGFYGCPPELLLFASKIFETILKDGQSEDRHQAIQALRFLAKHYREYPEPTAKFPTAPEAPVAPAASQEPITAIPPASTPVVSQNPTRAQAPKTAPSPASQPVKIRVPESLARTQQPQQRPAAQSQRQSVERGLPEPALGFFDENGRVRSYKDWKDATRPESWVEEVVWKFGGTLSNLTVPKNVARDFYDGIVRDPKVDHDYAAQAQSALAAWTKKR